MLLRYLDEIFSFTSDLGTEVKVTDYKINRANLNTILPTWLTERQNRSPLLEEEQEPSEAAARNPFLQCEGDELLRNALPVSGAGHMIHNTVRAFADVIPWFGTFYLMLKVVEMALGHAGRCERICATSLQGTAYSKHIESLKIFSFKLFESRWNAVAAFCQACILPLGVLRRCFSADAYLQRGRGELKEREWEKADGKKFDAYELERILKSALFRHYHTVVIKLHAIPSRLQSWFDGCPCHEGVLKSTKTRHARAQALRADGLSAGHCPCSTCRGFEVVDGKLAELVKELGDELETELKELIEMKASDGLTEPLTAEEFAIIMQAFSAGVTHLQLSFGVRLHWTQELPWMLMGIAHPHVARALFWCRRCIQAFNAKPEAKHHRKSVLFLKPGSILRVAIDAFLASGVMPAILQLHIAPFYFIPLGDRLIEREHKYISDITRPKTGVVRGHWFSIRRFRILEKRMFVDMMFANGLVEYFMSIKKIKSAIKIFGLERHPLFQEALRVKTTRAEKSVNDVLRGFLEQVIYRQELGIKYTSLDIVRKVNEAADNRWRAAEKKATAMPRAIPTTVEELLVLNAKDHLQAVGPSAGYITMPDRPGSGIQFQTASLLDEIDTHDVEQEGNDESGDDVPEGEVANESPAVDLDEDHVPKRRRIDEDAIVPADEDMESGPNLICFKVLKTRPGSMKSLQSFIERGGSKLAQSTFAVAYHSCTSCQETGALIVEERPRVVGPSGMRAMVVEDFRPQCSLETLSESMHGNVNDGPPSLRMSLPISMEGSELDLHNALDNMFKARAIVGKDGSVEGDASSWPWASMIENGSVQVLSTDDSNISRHVYR